MDYQDKVLVCQDCSKEFVFTAAEQEFYAQKGFSNEPKRCKDCRAVKKQEFRANREKHKVTCSNCGKEAEVPFKPVLDKPVYCDDCFKTMKASGSAPVKAA